jgi:hypothetical protein
MVEVTSIVNIITKAKSLTKFIESGKLSEAIFGDIALSSAKTSLSNAYMTQSYESCKNQVWNAISQFELSLTAHMNIVSSYDKIRSQGFGLNDSIAAMEESVASAGKVYYISCVMAICYTYLKEPILRDKYLSIAYKIINREWPRQDVLTKVISGVKILVTGIPEAAYLSMTKKKDPFFRYWWMSWYYDDKEIIRKETDELKSYLLQQD